MTKNTAFTILACLCLAAPTGPARAQTVRDGFNRAQTQDIDGSEKWTRLNGLTDPAATFQINADSTISPFHPLGNLNRGGVYWDSAISGRFQVGIVLRHKSGSDNIPTFHLQLMDDNNWLTGAGYGLRFQENAGTDRYDIQRITGSGTDTPYVALLATQGQELSAGDTLFFRFYEDGRKTAARYGALGVRDSVTVVDTTYKPEAWYLWIQGRTFPDSFKLDDFMIGGIPYRITAGAGNGGSISPSGEVLVDSGADGAFTITPATGFGITDVLVDSVSVGAIASYTFPAVGADHSIQALFDTLRYPLTANASSHGTITPSGNLTVTYGAEAAFTIAPDIGSHLDSLVVDGAPVDSTTSYTFHAVTAAHTISAYFSRDTYLVTATAGPNGTVSPSGSVAVPHGSDQQFVIAPDPGYLVDTLLVDGLPADSTTGYTFVNVTAPHTLSVTFVHSGLDTLSVAVKAKWNIVSVPLHVADGAPGTIFPSATGNAYAYSGAYSTADTLVPGRGYWIKFGADDSTVITGYHTAAETIDVAEGWNMVGAPSAPIPASGIVTLPPGLSASGFFGYSGSYVISPVLEPGRGYWVKMGGPGQLVLSLDPPANPASTLRIVRDNELPPQPPGSPSDDPAPEGLPASFRLGQNYPNPFNPSTVIDVDLPEASMVRMGVFNVIGEEVVRLLDGDQPAGRIRVKFEGGELPAGVYVCRVTAGSHVGQVKMLLVK